MSLLYTSYFANWRKFPNDAVQVSIASYAPQGFKGLQYTKLSPDTPLLQAYKKGKISWSHFSERYKTDTLSGLCRDKVLDDFSKIAHNHDLILLCWEKDAKQCHRSLVSSWLRANPDNAIIIKEL